jgi:hypothetical protein
VPDQWRTPMRLDDCAGSIRINHFLASKCRSAFSAGTMHRRPLQIESGPDESSEYGMESRKRA